ncbi:Motile sperm domain-containing protein 2 [Lamellibrachia satsuma]|nr:Motile sperm domain-containing protein 2 [Lamellibrachia satsuma]
MADDKNPECSVAALRDLFLTKYADSLETDYDSRDVEMVRNNDKFLDCFLSSCTDLNEVTQDMDVTLKLRKDYTLNDLTMESFPKEMLERNIIYWHGKNKDGKKIMYFKVAHHKKGTYVEDLKKYMAYFLEQHFKEHMGEHIAVVFDFSGAGLLNMDLEVVRFIISALSTYFPSTTAYILLFEMPMLLSAVWRVIRSWLSEAQKKKIFQVNKTSIQEYITTDQLEDHMVKK